MSIIESALAKKQKGEGKNDESSSTSSSAKDSVEQTQVEQTRTELPRSQSKQTVRQEISAMSQEKVLTPQELNDRGLISAEEIGSKLVNEYRNLRTKLLSMGNKKNFVTMVTSVNDQPNSCMVAANLASTFSIDASKTSLLLNADFSSKSKLDKALEVDAEFGLVDFVLSDDMQVEDVIYETPIPRMRYIPVGSKDRKSGEYFTSNRMQFLIKDIVTRYPERFPIINAPSITTSADARILLDVCDLVILVVPYGECSKDLVKQAAQEIGKEKLAGVILESF